MRSPFAGYVDRRESYLSVSAVRNGHIVQVLGLVEIIFEIGDVDVTPFRILIGSLRGQSLCHFFLSQVIPIGFGSIAPGNGNHRRHLEDEFIAAGIVIVGQCIARAVCSHCSIVIGSGGPLGIGTALQIAAQAGVIVAGRIDIDLPGAAGGDGICAFRIVHQRALASLGIDDNSALISAGRSQGALCILTIVIHSGAQGDLTGLSGGGQADLAAAGSRCTVIIGIGHNAMNFNIARRENGHVILVCIFQRSRSIRFRIFSRMNFSAYGYITCPGNLEAMIYIDSTMVIVSYLIGRIPNFHRTAINTKRIQSLSFTDISLKSYSTLTRIDFQIGISQVSFLDKAPGGFTTEVRIIPLVITAISNSQERSIVIRLCNCSPRFIGTPSGIQPIGFFPILSGLPI